MLILLGQPALSDFRANALLSEIQKVNQNISGLQAHNIYFVDIEQALNTQELITLTNILNDAKVFQAEDNGKSWQFLTIPRLGTISPWSSKATDILHHSGLRKVVRIEAGILYELQTSEPSSTPTAKQYEQIAKLLHDPMTQTMTQSIAAAEGLFIHYQPKSFQLIGIQENARDAIVQANNELGLSLTDDEIDYLFESFLELQRDPTDVELMMFAQANSEHSRHKIFNANWIINHVSKPLSLFQMVQTTHQNNPAGTLVAYKDNAAVITGNQAKRFFANPHTHLYEFVPEAIHIVAKVETHNHPTAIAPFPGAATGSGGEIRDEGATGLGAKPKAGMTGYSVSNLKIPGFMQPWEVDYGKPAHFASALQIMLTAPIGAAAFNNEFGRANLCGYFRTYEQAVTYNSQEVICGYHKPIMIAGGYGNIRTEHVTKKPLPVGTQIIVLGGPAMLIGLGGSAASSKAGGTGQAELDFASVQRANPEMQRRAQEVIDQCWALGDANPILSIHDVGAGGLSNAIPELIHADERGARLELRTIPSDEPGMSPMEIWCNEAQERYVLAIGEENMAVFSAIAERERCPFAVVGEIIQDEELTVGDGNFDNYPVDLPLSLLFGNTPKMLREAQPHFSVKREFITKNIQLSEAIQRVLNLPTVASKSFLITIGDRTVGGLTARDQMIGPWQIPVADCAVTSASFNNYFGEAMAVGERGPLAIVHHVASATMAVGEAITNIACAQIGAINKIKLSANWMAAVDFPGEDVGLFEAVQTVAMKVCHDLGISIPVGKDSLSMQTVWRDGEHEKRVVAPLTLVATAFAPVLDVRHTVTPELKQDQGDTDLIFIDLAHGYQRLGASALAQVYNQVGAECPDMHSPEVIKNFYTVIQALIAEKLLVAYHDRSDGGLLVTLCEMAFAGHVGLSILLNDLGDDPIKILFNEELGAVLQVRHCNTDVVLSYLREYGLEHHSHVIGTLNDTDRIEFYHHKNIVFADTRINLQRLWSQTSFQLQKLRDNPVCAEQEYATILQADDPGLSAILTFDSDDDISAPYLSKSLRPSVAILREQGVNGHIEMAAAFHHAGFTCHDVHMSDIINGKVDLGQFIGLVACGGFSYGDVLGAGRGWANTILYNARAYEQFGNFFLDTSTFALGVCNGCQMLSHLTELMPGTAHWPKFERNQSEQFEARLSRVKIIASPSILFSGMEGSLLPIVVSHGEGKANWTHEIDFLAAKQQELICMSYADNHNQITTHYPANPNGSPEGITGLTSVDGRFNILMPHPERVFRTSQFSWHPREWGEDSPWMRMFRNLRVWVG